MDPITLTLAAVAFICLSGGVSVGAPYLLDIVKALIQGPDVLPIDPPGVREFRRRVERESGAAGLARHVAAEAAAGFSPGRLNFAVVGETGTGKSRLLGALCGRSLKCSPCEEGTKALQKYEFRGCEGKLDCWDVPGLGTLNEPCDNYFVRHKLYCMDVLAIVFAERFPAHTLELCHVAANFSVRVVLVRTKADRAMQELRGTPSERQEQLRADTKAYVQREWAKTKTRLPCPPCYIFSAPDHEVWSLHQRMRSDPNSYPDWCKRWDEPHLTLEAALKQFPSDGDSEIWHTRHNPRWDDRLILAELTKCAFERSGSHPVPCAGASVQALDVEAVPVEVVTPPRASMGGGSAPPQPAALAGSSGAFDKACAQYHEYLRAENKRAAEQAEPASKWGPWR